MNVIFYFIINNRIIYALILLSLIRIISSFISFKEFNLLNNNVLLVTEDGIYRFNLDSQNIFLIKSFENDLQLDMIENADINKLPDKDGGYIFCKVFINIYIISKDADKLINNITIDDEYSSHTQSSIIPYISESIYYCILSFITRQNKIAIYRFKINFNSNENDELPVNAILEDNNMKYLDGISCHLIYSTLYQNNLIICFATNRNDYILNAIIFNPKNMSLLGLEYHYFDDTSHTDSNFIKSIKAYNKNIFLICQNQGGYPLKCQIYDFENNIWSEEVKLGNCFIGVQSNFNIYMTSKNEYIIFFNYNHNKYIIYNYEKNFKAKYKYIYSVDKCGSDYTFNTIILNKDRCYLLIICFSQNENEKFYMTSFTAYEIKEESTNKEDLKDFNVTLFPSLNNYISSSSDLEEQNPFSSSNLFESIINSSIKSILSSSLLVIPNSNFISSTLSSNFNKYENKIIINCEQDICIGKINETKEEIGNNLDEIMKNISIGTKYLIYGNDYNISIFPINDSDSFQSTFVDFSLCENILRIKNNLTNNETLTFLKIEIDKMNDKVLTNQIEYKIYNHKMEALNLSLCENIKVKVHYNIKDNLKLNKSMILYFSELGIDIFNINDSFFNDICFPFSNSNSDIILKDRISDIYQNYSLCDNNCEYDFIDIESNIVTCNCEIKKEVNTDVSTPFFNEIIESIFKDSNIGILKCHDLVFSLKITSHNIGFWIFLALAICHIPLYIHYSINGIKSILVYCEYNIRNRNDINSINYSCIHKENNLLNKKKIKKKNDKKKLKESFGCNKYIRNNIKYKTTILRKNNDIRISTKIKTFNKNKNNINGNKKKDKIYFKKDNDSKYLYSLKKNSKCSNSSISIIKIKRKDDFTNKKLKKVDNNIIHNINESRYNLEIYNFENAILYDKRKFWRLYYICLLSQERLLNTFFLKSPLEIKSLRISLFIFNYSCDLALNSFFYNNQKISDKYHYNGNNLRLFVLINNITVSLISAIVSILIIKFLSVLTQSKRRINNIFSEIKNNSNKKESKFKNNINIYIERVYKIFNILKFKIVCYIAFEITILLFFFYYVTGFCIVYQKTQIDWLLESIISILLSILFKLLYSFFIAILYIISLKKKSKLLFKIALFFY